MLEIPQYFCKVCCIFKRTDCFTFTSTLNADLTAKPAHRIYKHSPRCISIICVTYFFIAGLFVVERTTTLLYKGRRRSQFCNTQSCSVPLYKISVISGLISYCTGTKDRLYRKDGSICPCSCQICNQVSVTLDFSGNKRLNPTPAVFSDWHSCRVRSFITCYQSQADPTAT